MKTSSIQQQRNILRLLYCFEKNLKRYHEYFDNDYYQMSYIVNRCPFNGDFTIEVTMNIWNNKYYFSNIETTSMLLSKLKSFCAIFSMQKFKVVRQLKRSAIQSLDIEDRIGYGVYQKTIN